MSEFLYLYLKFIFVVIFCIIIFFVCSPAAAVFPSAYCLSDAVFCCCLLSHSPAAFFLSVPPHTPFFSAAVCIIMLSFIQLSVLYCPPTLTYRPSRHICRVSSLFAAPPLNLLFPPRPACPPPKRGLPAVRVERRAKEFGRGK